MIEGMVVHYCMILIMEPRSVCLSCGLEDKNREYNVKTFLCSQEAGNKLTDLYMLPGTLGCWCQPDL